ncbi:hypothetical protein A3A67_04150 [Candidatus Peribacteria bacterium RIFCSPLOWO2_01_FULL_51_18]|nr:MAG: hypothetical protein A3C52_04030 [Candidatus Peribacteria bacterium RIFCSPHIGHO2_02_FULL_51_15]OGJ65822.1 MAG: hypothetical protein A3A67_04150 [Candidatus Peribacteria bacterium RIFCSPLOWO2_01_FULL_51_18]OGJ68451.1 MAG: hypothetical protein A3J34_04665 [Candidatus Peribacteria bacterium RIFCSPLOWO2_02_FULL_51_10]
MESLPARIREANNHLASYAVPHGGGLGRVYREPDDATRFPFQRDRDRIIHTQSFRRLKHKTQVFIAGHGDHFRTRITHTLEVAQISRDIARTLKVNEDLTEAIALAHDLGHTPFGHAGEDAMRECLKPYGKNFEHNLQSLRVVTLLEDRSDKYPGLNLCREILEGLDKHSTPHDQPPLKLRPAGRPFSNAISSNPSLEAQIVNLADEIAYTAHDAEDGIRSGLFDLDAITKTRLGARGNKRILKSGNELRGALVDILIMDLYSETERRIGFNRIGKLTDVYSAEAPLAGFSSPMEKELAGLRDFLWRKLYFSPAILRQAGRGKRIIKKLFSRYMENPPRKVVELKNKTGGSLPEAVKDFIAGMTDTYAVEAYEKVREVRKVKKVR